MTDSPLSSGGSHSVSVPRLIVVPIVVSSSKSSRLEEVETNVDLIRTAELQYREAFGEKPAKRLRARYRNKGELTSIPMRRLLKRAQQRKERQHKRDRKLLMHYEKQRAEMRKNMGLNPVLG